LTFLDKLHKLIIKVKEIKFSGIIQLHFNQGGFVGLKAYTTKKDLEV
jgi:hypothetical protein